LERRNGHLQAEYDVARSRLAEIERSTEAELAALRAERDELVSARAEQQALIKQLQRSIAKATAEREQAVNQVVDERDALQRMLAVERDKLAWIQGEVEVDRSRMRNLEIACSGYVARINALKHAVP
jgi:chromosome segregation ATPase